MESHLLQMRGLKPVHNSAKRLLLVASFTDAWIETLSPRRPPSFPPVASFTDAWIETVASINVISFVFVASFTDAWIETDTLNGLTHVTTRRIFYRCVD